MRLAALALAALCSCSALAPRMGVCPSPQSLALGGAEPILCGLVDGSPTDVWCVFRVTRSGRVCRVYAETSGCGEWRARDVDCGERHGSDA